MKKSPCQLWKESTSPEHYNQLLREHKIIIPKEKNNIAMKSFYYQPIFRAIAKNGSERLGIQAFTKSWSEDMPEIKMEVTISAKTFTELKDKVNSFFMASEMLPCEYYLCSASVVDKFKPFEVSKPFKSGFEFEENELYYVAWLNFAEVEKYYNEVVEPDENLSESDFWCRECIAGTMDSDKVSIRNAKKIGLLLEIAQTLDITAQRNQAMTIHNLSKRYGCTPVELINKYL